MFKDISPFKLVLGAIFGFAALAGLAAFALSSSGGDSARNIAIWTDVNNSYLEEWFKQADEDDYKVTYRYIKSDELVRTVIDELSLGRYPDILVTDVNKRFELGARLQDLPFESLSKADFNERYVSGARPMFETARGYAGLPMFVDSLVLYSNAAKLNENGIATPPKYWDEVSSITNQFAKRSNTTVQEVVTPIGTSANTDNYKDILSAMLLQVDKKIIFDSENRLIVDVNGSKANSVVAYYTDFANPNSGVYNWNASFKGSKEEFLAGNTFFYLGYTSEHDQLLELNPNLDIMISELPQIRGNAKSTYAKFYGALFPNANRNLGVSFDLLNDLMDKELLGIVATEGGLTAATRSEVNTNASIPLGSVGAKSALYAQGWLDPDFATTTNAFATMIDNVLYRGTAPKSAVSALDLDLRELLSQE